MCNYLRSSLLGACYSRSPEKSCGRFVVDSNLTSIACDHVSMILNRLSFSCIAKEELGGSHAER